MPQNILFSTVDVLAMLKQRQGVRDQNTFAQEIGISFQLLSDIYRGTRNPGQQVLRYLDLEKMVAYRKRR
jgi:transcriptional regulator with XRE-family HTH domain